MLLRVYLNTSEIKKESCGLITAIVRVGYSKEVIENSHLRWLEAKLGSLDRHPLAYLYD
jgi:hypothetical protein